MDLSRLRQNELEQKVEKEEEDEDNCFFIVRGREYFTRKLTLADMFDPTTPRSHAGLVHEDRKNILPSTICGGNKPLLLFGSILMKHKDAEDKGGISITMNDM